MVPTGIVMPRYIKPGIVTNAMNLNKPAGVLYFEGLLQSFTAMAVWDMSKH